jgi:hypothetical protein
MSYSQPGIYNVLDTIYAGGMSSSPVASATQNALALQAAITTAEANGGGIILIPSNDGPPNNDGNTYLIAPPGTQTYCVSISGNVPLVIMGAGGATKLLMTKHGDVFDTSGYTGSSLTFQDLFLQYDQTGPSKSGKAFNLVDCKNVHLVRLRISDCEQPIAFANAQAASIERTLVDYTPAFPNNLTPVCIQIGADSSGIASSQVSVNASTFRVNPNNTGTYVGIQITAGSGIHFESVHVSYFSNAIEIVPTGTASCSDISFNFAAINSPTLLLIQPQTASASISNVTFFHSSLVYGGAIPPNTTGIDIDTNSFSNSQITTIAFDNCNVSGNGLYGMNIKGGQYISIRGGLYASNTTSGIAITGAASHVVIDGAVFTGPSYYSSNTQSYGLTVENGASNVLVTACTLTGNTIAGIYINNGATGIQVRSCNTSNNSAYGVSVANSCTDVYIANCNLTGNPSGAVSLNAPGTLQIVDCAGYNDQATVLTTTAPQSGTTFTGATSPYDYYGPVVFYTFSTSIFLLSVTIDGITTQLMSGTFTIGPAAPSGTGESASLMYTAAPLFLMAGH